MGHEAQCTGVIAGRRSRGRLLLETDHLLFRGDPRFVAPLHGLRATVRAGRLEIEHDGVTASFELGDAAFLAELRARARWVVTRASAHDLDLVFFRADAPAALGRLAALRQCVAPAGAIWLITPKGRAALGHGPVVAAAKAAGLVDVKTARCSETHVALKLMIPRADRAR